MPVSKFDYFTLLRGTWPGEYSEREINNFSSTMNACYRAAVLDFLKHRRPPDIDLYSRRTILQLFNCRSATTIYPSVAPVIVVTSTAPVLLNRDEIGLLE